jgi:glycosyltransferase involved in cell wall biosynthesis
MRAGPPSAGTVTGLNFFTNVGDHYGAGVAGKGFALALAGKLDLRLALAQPLPQDKVPKHGDPGEWQLLQRLSRKPPDPSLPSFVRGAPMARRWLCPEQWPRRGARSSVQRAPFVAHVFFEFEKLMPDEVAFLREADVVTSGSSWAEQVLAAHGLPAATIHQGVNLTVFHPGESERPEHLRDRFVVWSGGKYEYRKGWDLVIAAFARFVQRRPDAFLIANAWNPWPATQAGLAHSPHFEFSPVERYPEDMGQVLIDNGIPEDSFELLSPSSRSQLARAMRRADCGLFPIRAEGGTNHFLMELMACGKPVIATHTTGLTDILRPGENCLALQELRAVTPNIVGPERDRGTWLEPTVAEIVAALDSLYGSADTRARLARGGLETIAGFAWDRCADRLLQVIGEASEVCHE